MMGFSRVITTIKGTERILSKQSELWLGRGRPLNPYLKGVIIDFLRREMRPLPLSLAPDELFPKPQMHEFLEWSTLRSWVRHWLQYCRWYYSTALDPEVTIEQFFDAPMVNRKWKIDRVDPQLTRFGVLLKVYDMVALKGIDFRLPILTEGTTSPNGVCYLFGGVSGTDFLVTAVGCEQPAAGRGIVYPGVKRLFGERCPSKTVRYKTLGVSERECILIRN